MKKLLAPFVFVVIELLFLTIGIAFSLSTEPLTPTVRNYQHDIVRGEQLSIVFPELTLRSSTEMPTFVTVEPTGLAIDSSHEHPGDFVFTIPAASNSARYLLNFNLTITMPPVDFISLQKETEALIADFDGIYSVYVYDLKREQGFDINGAKEKAPASISKLPYAILTLHEIEQGNMTLEDTYPISSRSKAYSSDLMYYFANGKEVTLDEYMSYLIRESDNTAMMHLEAIHGGLANFNEQTASRFGITELNRQPHRTNASAVGDMLTKIYRQEYLQKEQNDVLINYMKTTDDKYSDRIVAGVPSEVEVAHKIGNDVYSTGLIYNDAGIVYGEVTDFVIVVLGDHVSSTSVGGREIAEITKLIYNSLN
jgi:beta-lactamase class A